MKKSQKVATTKVKINEVHHQSLWANAKFLLIGLWFGILLVKAEVLSWFRIQEMFRLESFHMYGVIGSAIAVGVISILIIKKFNIKTIDDEPITIPSKVFRKGQIFGGFIFGLGWAMTGACPGPLYANLGYGYTIFVVPIFFAIVGTYVYGLLKEQLPN